jgi:hypothetical protein
MKNPFSQECSFTLKVFHPWFCFSPVVSLGSLYSQSRLPLSFVFVTHVFRFFACDPSSPKNCKASKGTKVKNTWRCWSQSLTLNFECTLEIRFLPFSFSLTLSSSSLVRKSLRSGIQDDTNFVLFRETELSFQIQEFRCNKTNDE